jgi:hypothetical protein
MDGRWGKCARKGPVLHLMIDVGKRKEGGRILNRTPQESAYLQHFKANLYLDLLDEVL